MGSERRGELLTELASANVKETLVRMQTLARETLISPSLEVGKEQAGKDLFVLVLFLTLLLNIYYWTPNAGVDGCWTDPP